MRINGIFLRIKRLAFELIQIEETQKSRQAKKYYEITQRARAAPTGLASYWFGYDNNYKNGRIHQYAKVQF